MEQVSTLGKPKKFDSLFFPRGLRLLRCIAIDKSHDTNPWSPCLDGTTLVSDLAFPDPWMVIEQAFGILAWQDGHLDLASRPRDLAAVAALAKLPVDAVVSRLKAILGEFHDIEVSAVDLDRELTTSSQSAATPFLLDVRERWEFARAAIPASLLILDLDFEPWLASMLASGRPVVVICHHGVRSLSAALFLRGRGIRAVRSLRGGVEAWATQVDLTMPRY